MKEAKRIPRKLKKKIKKTLQTIDKEIFINFTMHGITAELKGFGDIFKANKEGFLIQTYTNA